MKKKGNNKKVYEILQKFYQRKKRVNPLYSIRALSLTLKLDTSFVNRILNGKKKFPFERIADFIKVLEMDTLGVKELKRALIWEYAREIDYQDEDVFLNSENKNQKSGFLDNFEEFKSENTTTGLFQNWYRLALLELSTIPHYEFNLKKLSQQMNIDEQELENAMKYLIDQKYLIQDSDGRWTKASDKIRFATKESQANIRRFHKDIMSKSVEEMYQNIDKTSFEKRYITSGMLTIGSDQVEKIRIRLQEMILEVIDFSNKDTVQNLYGVHFSFFPLVKLD